MLKYLTSGESHGKCLVAILEGMPANLHIDIDNINNELKKRQTGYGRGGRMAIEKDNVEILSGMRGSITIGSPIAMMINNKDYENWTEYMNPVNEIDKETKKVTKARPGHADLTGSLKYDFDDIRNVLERSSARETAIRVSVGAICKELLKEFNIDFTSHVIHIGNSKLENVYEFDFIKEHVDNSEVRCIVKDIESNMIKEIKDAKEDKDTLGGIFEIRIKNLPPGLGSYVHFEKKIDAELARHLMSIQAIKGVEIGLGFDVANHRGSKVQDQIYYNEEKGIYRSSNNLGGIEGGMTNGDEVIIRCAMKPIPTLYTPLDSIDIETLEGYKASIERSDVCAVPAASIVGENVAAFVIAKFFLDKFGSDNIGDIKSSYHSYMERLERRGWKK